MAIFGWLSRLVGGDAGASQIPVEFDEEELSTDAGRFMVVLHTVGANRSAVVAVLRVFAPLDEAELELALDHMPYKVREGLTRTAAEAILDRLAAVGAQAGITEASV